MKTSFKMTGFDGYASFFNARFYKPINFTEVIHAYGRLNFNGAKFFGASKFFRLSSFGYGIELSDTYFAKAAEFRKLSVKGDVNFSGTQFARKVVFDHLKVGELNFYESKFNDTIKFVDVKVKSNANFDQCKFDQKSDFTGFKCKKFTATQSEFKEASIFDRINVSQFIDLKNSLFQDSASFRSITWPIHASGWHGAFRNTEFFKIADFTGSGCRSFASFSGAIFNQGVSLDLSEQTDLDKAFELEKDQALETAQNDYDAWIIETTKPKSEFSQKLDALSSDYNSNWDKLALQYSTDTISSYGFEIEDHENKQVSNDIEVNDLALNLNSTKKSQH